jgi:hypothetical protein
VRAGQVEAWVGTRKGSIHEAARSIDAALADAALGRMMLHRRRAVTATVINEFFARAGSRFAPYVENRAPEAPLDPAGERAIAARAGELVVGLCGAPPALAFERALLAEEQGRFDDAHSDLKEVLAACPGFVAAAIAAARLALASGDPPEALRTLAPVEGEITHARDGAALLADAARAIGLHQSASCYDLVALVSRGEYDGRGNDCVPIDLTGKIVDDERMPQSLYLEGEGDGSVICNVGGIYYSVNPFVGHWLSVMNRGRRLSGVRSLGPRAPTRRGWPIAQTFEAATARLQLLFVSRFPEASAVLRKYFVLAGPGLQRFFEAVFRLAISVNLALLVFLYRPYLKSPASLQAWTKTIIRSLLVLLRPLVRDRIGPLFGPRGRWSFLLPITEAHARAELAEAQYRSGVARIFGLQRVAQSTGAGARLGAFAEQRISAGGKPSPPPGKLPPEAEDVLRHLLSETDIARLAPLL